MDGVVPEQRNTHLRALKEQFNAHADEMAERMVLEMGKPLNEARGEAASLGARIDLMIANGLKRVATESLTALRVRLVIVLKVSWRF